MLSLSPPARYFPLEKGIYEVAPGLKTLGTDFGNGPAEARVFQLDREFARYRDNKDKCRKERLSKYFQLKLFEPEVERRVVSFIAKQLPIEHPELFRLEALSQGGHRLEALHTRESLLFDREWNWAGGPEYSHSLDALASQIQEDLAVVSRKGQEDWLSCLHLCSPSHWAAEDKIGLGFFSVHAPIPGIERLNRAAASWVDAMIHKGPYVRFVWGFATDQRLNHHPIPAPGHDPALWKGRAFDLSRAGSPFHLRVERQTLRGFPDVEAALFTIRVSFIDGEEIRRNPTERALLRSALLSMTPESLEYKGLSQDRDAVIDWLDQA